MVQLAVSPSGQSGTKSKRGVQRFLLQIVGQRGGGASQALGACLWGSVGAKLVWPGGVFVEQRGGRAWLPRPCE